MVQIVSHSHRFNNWNLDALSIWIAEMTIAEKTVCIVTLD